MTFRCSATTSLILIGMITLSLGGASSANAARITYEFETDVGYYGTFAWDPGGEFIGFGARSGAETAVGFVWGPTGGNHLDVTLYEPAGSLILDAQYTSADIWVWQDRVHCEDGFCQEHDFDALYFDLFSGPTTSDFTSIRFTDNTGLIFPYRTGVDTGDLLPEYLHDPINLSDFSSATVNGMAITQWNQVPEPTAALLFGTGFGVVGIAARRKRSNYERDHVHRWRFDHAI